jgi:hypothetical protein
MLKSRHIRNTRAAERRLYAIVAKVNELKAESEEVREYLRENHESIEATLKAFDLAGIRY